MLHYIYIKYADTSDILNMPIPQKSAVVPDRAFRMPWR